jgi:hypothetical protein
MGFGLLAAFVLALFPGCKKSASTEQPQNERPKRIIASGPVTPTLPASDIVVRVHWLGRSRIAADTNSAFLMKIWDMPESAKLEAHVLDQFSLAPWRMLPGNTNFAVTNPASALLRPLLDDIVQQESWLEVYAPSNQPVQIAFAINLPPDRAALWQTNLALLTSSLTPHPLVPPKSDEGGSPLLSRSGDWTLLGWSQATNLLISDLQSHLSEWESVEASRPTKLWFETSLDIPRAAAALCPDGSPAGTNRGRLEPLPYADWPRIELSVTGDGNNLLTRCQLDFPKPLNLDLEPWNIPTNLIRGPLNSFAAIRGIRDCLSSWKSWNDLELGTPPNQAYFWGQQAQPMLTYCAAPMPGASNAIAKLAGFLLTQANPWMTTNAMGQFQKSPVANGVDCTAGNPMLGTFAESVSQPQGEFLFAGFGRSDLTNIPPPAPVMQELQSYTNLVAYEREVTGARIKAWIYLGQALRVILYQAQLPFDGPVMKWLNMAGEKLGDSKTFVTQTGPARLTVNGISGAGLTSMEIHLLADWVESPHFPRGLNTFEGQAMAKPRPHHWTNSAPATNR